MIRAASEQDLDAIKRIADKNKDTLGFILRPALKESINHHELLVVDSGGIQGFCNYHHRRDGQTTIYEICVEESARLNGIGRDMIGYLIREARECGQRHITLKCIDQNLAANLFYLHLGFSIIATQAGKRRPLNVWRLTVAHD